MNVRATLDVATAVCLTADRWTSVNNNSFLAIAAHFLEETMCVPHYWYVLNLMKSILL
jgi:hypothetical protein